MKRLITLLLISINIINALPQHIIDVDKSDYAVDSAWVKGILNDITGTVYETTSRTIYVSTTGSDLTGDGSSTKPYATIKKALQSVRKYITKLTYASNIEITLQLDTGSYDINQLTVIEMIKFRGSGKLTIQGANMSLVQSGLSCSSSGETFLYNVTVGGGSPNWTTNELKGKFVFIQATNKYYPIHSNTSNQIEYATTTATTSIHELKTRLNVNADIVCYIDLVINNCIINISEHTLIGCYDEHNLYITQCYIYYNETAKVIYFNSKSEITRCAFLNVQLQFSKYAICFGSSYYVNSGTYNNINIVNNAQLLLSVGNIIENPSGYGIYIVESRLTDRSGTAGYLKFKNTLYAFKPYNQFEISLNGSTNLVLVNVSYLVRKYQDMTYYTNSQLYIRSNIIGSPTTRLFYDSMNEFINNTKNYNIYINGLFYPEYETNLKYTWNNNTSGSVVVGNTSQNYAVDIDYVIARGTLREAGTIRLTNKSDSNIEQVKLFDDCKVTFGKNISGSNIQLTYSVDNSVDNATVTFTQVRRAMITPLTL